MPQRELLESLLDEAAELRIDRARSVRLCETVLGVSDGRFPAIAARAWRLIGHARLYDSDFPRATEAYTQSRGRAEALGDSAQVAHALMGLGEVAQRSGDTTTALLRFRAAKEQAPEDFGSAWLIHNHLGNVLNAVGRHEEALEHYDLCRAEMDDRTPARRAAVVLGNIGVVHALRGDLGQATGFFEGAARQWERTVPVAGTATNLGNLGKVYCLMGESERGIPLQATAIRLMGEMGYLDGQMEEYIKLAESLEHLGNTEGAVEAYRQALELARPLELHGGERIVRAALARLVADPAEAEHHRRYRENHGGQNPSEMA